MQKSITFRIFLSIIFLSFFSNQLISQTKTSGGEGYFMVGMQMMDIQDLNTILQVHNYPTLDKYYTAIGGGGYGFVNNYVIGGEGFGLIGNEVSNQNYKLNLSAGYGMFNVGYVIYNQNGLKLFPVVGFGAGGINLTIYEKSNLDFSDIMNNPKRGSSLSLGGLMFNLGVNVSFTLNLNDNENTGGLLIGLSTGYTYFLKLGDWTLFENEISGGPKIGISGFYLRFMIGGGGNTKN